MRPVLIVGGGGAGLTCSMLLSTLRRRAPPRLRAARAPRSCPGRTCSISARWRSSATSASPSQSLRRARVVGWRSAGAAANAVAMAGESARNHSRPQGQRQRLGGQREGQKDMMTQRADLEPRPQESKAPTRVAVMCLGPEAGGVFEIRESPRGRPAAGEIEVAVEAASVNPVDVRRAAGYGRRLLSLMGASRFPMTLGNDFAGTIVAVGERVTAFAVGDHVYGVKPVSRDGSHASHVLVKAACARKAPAHSSAQDLAALPYGFITMWLAARGAGLHARKRGRQEGSGARRDRRLGDAGAADALCVGRARDRYREGIEFLGLPRSGSRGSRGPRLKIRSQV